MDAEIPPAVGRVYDRASTYGFSMSCDPAVGRFLSVLAAGVRPNGRVLELGTGFGAGLAWLLHGLSDRQDVDVISVEANEELHSQLVVEPWPVGVDCLLGDAVELLPQLGSFDVIFADAQGGKWDRLDLTIAALAPTGVLLVDDMTPTAWVSGDHRINTERVRATLLGHPLLVAAELSVGSGVVVAVKRVSD